MRDLQLTLLDAGGAEVVDVDTDTTVWASDTDEDFAEEFPEILDENDVEHLLDYLEEHEVCTSRELEVMEIISEPLGGGDDDPDDEFNDEDDDDDDLAPWDDPDTIDGEVIEHE